MSFLTAPMNSWKRRAFFLVGAFGFIPKALVSLLPDRNGELFQCIGIVELEPAPKVTGLGLIMSGRKIKSNGSVSIEFAPSTSFKY